MLCFLGFHFKVFDRTNPMSITSEKSKSPLPFAWAGHLRLHGVTCLSAFRHLHFQRSVQGWMVQNMQHGVTLPQGCAHSEAYTIAVYRNTGLCRQGQRGVDRQINMNFCCSLVVQGLNNQIPSVYSANWIAYDKIIAFSPTLFNLHLEKYWKWHGKVRPININNCSLFASTVLQHAAW